MIQIKNAKELDGMRRANALSAAALKYGGDHIEAGDTVILVAKAGSVVNLEDAFDLAEIKK